MIEIERKFLVRNHSFLQEATAHYPIKQGFLNTNPERCVRIRIKGNEGYITVKGKSNKQGTSRFEWEKRIPKHEAEQLLALCEPHPIEKIRYEVPIGKHLFEVDVFSGSNSGLVVAEIELTQANETFITPPWLGNEVTGDKKYYNSSLAQKPYTQWE